MKAGMNIIEYPWISPTRWFLQTDAQGAGLNFFFGWKPRFSKGAPHPDNGAVVFRETMSLASGSLQLLSLFLIA